MEPVYEEYLDYLQGLSDLLGQMTETAKAKAVAASTGDLIEVDKHMKQEQIYSLTLRGMDQKRDKLLKAMGLEGTSISQLAGHYPPEHRVRAGRIVEQVQRNYELYESAATRARTTMECALRDIERMFPKDAKPAPAEEPPPRMRTDFRA